MLERVAIKKVFVCLSNLFKCFYILSSFLKSIQISANPVRSLKILPGLFKSQSLSTPFRFFYNP